MTFEIIGNTVVMFALLWLVGIFLSWVMVCVHDYIRNWRKNRVNKRKINAKLRVSKKLLTEWLDEQPDYGICSPPMDAQTALNYLFDYLDLSPVVLPQSTEQCNTVIVFDILIKHSKRFREEYHQYLKKEL